MFTQISLDFEHMEIMKSEAGCDMLALVTCSSVFPKVVFDVPYGHQFLQQKKLKIGQHTSRKSGMKEGRN